MNYWEFHHAVFDSLPSASSVERVSSLSDDTVYRYLHFMDYWTSAGPDSIIKTDPLLSLAYRHIQERFESLLDIEHLSDFRVFALYD